MPVNTFSSEVDYLIHLLNCVLRNEHPQEMPDTLNFEKLFELAQFHSVANLSFYAVEKLKKKPEPELMKKWAEVRDKAICKDIIQQTEFENIAAAFNEHNMKFLPLKGIIIKNLYPQTDMRLMSDIDILIEEKCAAEAKEIMLSLGYYADYTEIGYHDVYMKKPIMNVEIHRRLFGTSHKNLAKAFNSKVWNMAEHYKDFQYRFKKSEFFVHILSHSAMHYVFGGTGIRSFMDIWVYYNKYRSELDLTLFEKILDKETAELCRDLLAVSEIWFGDKENDGSYNEIIKYVLSSGTYGVVSNVVSNQLKEGKLKYLLRNIFLPYSAMLFTFPFLKKAPFLLPVCWIIRPFIKIFTKHRVFAVKIKALFNK